MSAQKLLGVRLDQHLAWTAHIDNFSYIASKISLLRQLVEYVPTCAQKQFYQRYILPLIEYRSITWGTTSIANIQRLSKLQKRAARIILKANCCTPSFPSFNNLTLSCPNIECTIRKHLYSTKTLALGSPIENRV